jgi:hypothetical protein
MMCKPAQASTVDVSETGFPIPNTNGREDITENVSDTQESFEMAVNFKESP